MTAILILGGYGYTGRLIAKYLLSQTDARVIIGGRHLDKAQSFANELNDPRLTIVQVDASNEGSLQAALRADSSTALKPDLCLVAAPTTHQADQVIRACLAAHIDYLDVQFSSSKLAALRAAEQEIRRAGLCFVTEAGYHPGLPSAMIRYAAAQMDSLERARIGCYLNVGLTMPFTEAIDELMEAFIDYQAQVFKNGAWGKPGSFEMVKFDFGGSIGARNCYSMFFEELRDLPNQYPSLRDMGLYMAGFNWFVDWVLTPLIMVGLKVAPKQSMRPLGKLMWWGIQKFSKPPFEVVLQVNASGSKNDSPIEVQTRIAHPDGYELTAIPVVAYLKQYLDGSARCPGLHMMGHLAEPVRLIDDMAAMGADVSTTLQSLHMDDSIRTSR